MRAFFYVLIFLPSILIAQRFPPEVWTYPITHYGVNDGLSQSQVICTHVDNKGYLWLGTKVGLNRFNGIDFDNYLNNSLYPSSHIKDIVSDTDGNIWVTSSRAIYCMRPDSIIDYSSLLAPYKLSPEGLYEANGVLYFIGKQENKRNVWKLENEILHPVSDTSQNNNLYAKVITNGSKVISYGWSPSTKYFFIHSFHKNSIDTIAVRSPPTTIRIYPTEQKKALVQIADSIFQIKEENLDFIVKKPLGVTFSSMNLINNLVIGATRKHVYIYNNQRWEKIDFEFNLIRSVTPTSHNDIWVSTEDGAFRINYGLFKIFPREKGLSEATWSIIEDKRKIYFSAYRHGIYTLDSTGYHSLPVNAGSPGRQDWYMGAQKLVNGKILFPNGMGTMVFDNGNWYPLKEDTPLATFSYFQDSTEELYIGTDSLIKILHPFTDSSKREAILDAGLNSRFILDIERDTNDVLWVSAPKTFFKIVQDSVLKFDNNNSDVEGAYCIHKDCNGNLWFGSNDGLLLYEYTSTLPRPFLRMVIKFPVFFIESFHDEYLLVGSLQGLYIIKIGDNPSEESVVWEYVSDARGFEGQEAGQNGVYKNEKGEIWMLTTDKAILFNSPKYKLIIPELDIHFSKYTFRNTEHELIDSTTYLNLNSLVKIETRDKNLKIYFDAINYQYASQIEFRTKLQGYNDEWSTASRKRSIEFTALPAGRYNLLVEAIINGKIVDSKTISVHVNASTKWESQFWVTYRKYIFSGIVFMLMGIGITTFFWQYRKRKNSENTALRTAKENMELEFQLIRSQVSPHFIFNTLNNLKARLPIGSLVYNSIIKFSELLYLVFMEEKQILIPLSKELSVTKQFIELEALRKDFEYNLSSDKEINLDNILIPRLLIQSLVNNVFKHAIKFKPPNGPLNPKFTITITQENNFIIVKIRDNGVGLTSSISPKEDKQSGNGIDLINRTLKLLDQQHGIKGSHIILSEIDSSENFPGTLVTVHFYANYHIKTNTDD